MEKIRVKSSSKRIEVNDKGDCIVLPIDDTNFIKKMYDLYELTTSDETKNMFGDSTFSDAEKVQGVREFNQKLLDSIDDLFGTGACKKIFCEFYEDNDNAMPGLFAIVSFLEQILPIAIKYAKEMPNPDNVQKYLNEIK